MDRLGSIADAAGQDFLGLESLDVDIPPDTAALARTREAAVRECYLKLTQERIAYLQE